MDAHLCHRHQHGCLKIFLLGNLALMYLFVCCFKQLICYMPWSSVVPDRDTDIIRANSYERYYGTQGLCPAKLWLIFLYTSYLRTSYLSQKTRRRVMRIIGTAQMHYESFKLGYFSKVFFSIFETPCIKFRVPNWIYC